MQALFPVCNAVDRLSGLFGRIAAYLVLIACLISAGNAGMRYAFSMSSNAWLEVQWYMFSGMFLLGAAYTLRVNEHVRVDIFYGMVSDRGRLWIDTFGIIFFLLPATIMLTAMTWPFFWESWIRGEMSSNAGGLPRWPVKLLLPMGFALLTLQGLAELVRRFAALAGIIELNLHYERPLQ
jgi:TRAP-type mannitol/chloroaromatic compound transport system permease small subunit